MMIPLVDLKRQFQTIRDEIKEKIVEVLESGRFILGENVEKFEEEFAKYCGAKYAVGVASGTDALRFSLEAIGQIKDCEVISVPNTFVSTIDAIYHLRAMPVFVDIDSKTYNIDVSQIRAKITNKTKVLIPVHLYGHPVDMDPLLEVADEEGLNVIEDACQAHGAEYKGQRVGSFGDCACFSFYPSKNLGAYGDAGMVVTNDGELADKVRMLREYGQKRKYDHMYVGYNSRLDEIQAGILSVKLKYLDRWIEDRRKNADKYNEYLSDISGVTLPSERRYAKQVYYLYVIRSTWRDEMMKWLGSKGISTGIHYPIPVHLQKSYKHLNLGRGSFPIAEQCAREVLSLPMFPELTEDEISYICDCVEAFVTQL